jgi:predicted helicase
LPTFTKAIANHLDLKFVPDSRGDLQQTFGPEDIFNYIYAVFHSPTYRERYAEFLKIDFPRLPLTSNADLFRQLCSLGDRLVGLHLMKKFDL